MSSPGLQLPGTTPESSLQRQSSVFNSVKPINYSDTTLTVPDEGISRAPAKMPNSNNTHPNIMITGPNNGGYRKKSRKNRYSNKKSKKSRKSRKSRKSKKSKK
jgi:hypothetical protein